MKNLTAHYNIYFNANELLQQSKKTISQSTEDDFSQLLNIFPLPDAESAANESDNLNQVIDRANLIALDKYESNWLDDAYLLLAEAQYQKADFYNAIEYFSYVSLSFPKEKKNKLAAYLGQAKSDFALNLNKDADSVLNLAVKLNQKYKKDELDAALAQLAVIKNNIPEAISHLENALSATHKSDRKIRWRYILAQLQELNNQPKKAIANYSKIAKSNAAFIISFNANLSRIRISEAEEGKKFDKIATLRKLLKEDKNKEFKEQIYSQIGNAYFDQNNLDKAAEYYTIAAHTVPGTVTQKGLNYLKLAQLNFNQLKNYTQAQLYYDSTLQFLPKTYPDYKNITIKANNLQYLADRLVLIEKEKTGLKLASLNEAEIDQKVDELIKARQTTELIQKQQEQIPTVQLGDPASFSSINKNAGSFYFYNSAALSQGLSEFKRKWGNRKLTDNWRVSSTNLSGEGVKSVFPENVLTKNLNSVINKDSVKADFIKTIPYSNEAKAVANQKIITALYEIAMFYKDVLKEEGEAIEALEAITINYPNDKNIANIYYQLYRLTVNTDKNKSETYKKQLLEKFPNSIFAKTISDPNFGKEKELATQRLKNQYNNFYILYLQKKYGQVLTEINTLRSKLGSFNELDPQFAYLEALALGNTQKIPAFLASLNDIISKYPNDTEVTPIAKKQIDFIGKNRTTFDLRPTALVSYSANESSLMQPIFIPKVETEIKEAPKAVVKETPKPTIKEVPKPIIKETPKPEIKEITQPIVKETPKPEVPQPVIKEIPEPVETVAKDVPPVEPEQPKETVIEKVEPVVPIEKEPEAIVNQPIVPEVPKEIIPEKPAGLVFNENLRQRYLIVLDVFDPKQNLVQPFSKLSQYFYSKFDPATVKLVIRVVGAADKFIIVSGNFYTKEEVDKVAAEMKENLPKIMEGLTKQYQEFVISEENLKLLTDRSAIDQYLKAISEKK